MPVLTTSVFVLTAILLLAGVPVAVGFGLSSLAVLAISRPVPAVIVPQMVWTGVENFVLVAVPFFILAGNLMSTGGVARRLINLSNAVLGWTRGGLGAVNILVSLLFGGMSGSSIADAATFGTLLVPEMIADGYSADYSAAVTVTSSTLAVVVPPSILMVVLGVVAEQSVARLLVGGLIPGVVITIGLLIANYVLSTKYEYGSYVQFSWQGLKDGVRQGVGALGAPIVILGGIMSGIVTPTEAAAVAVFYTMFASWMYGEFSWSRFFDALVDTGKVTGSIMLIVASSTLFTWIVSWENVPALLVRLLLSLTTNPAVILLIINFILFLAGMFIDASAAIIILSPLLYPVITQIGVDPIHFGVVMVMALAIGLVTPPFGVCLFTICTVTKIPVERVVKASLPFLASLILTWFLATYIPGIVLFLPRLVFG